MPFRKLATFELISAPFSAVRVTCFTARSWVIGYLQSVLRVSWLPQALFNTNPIGFVSWSIPVMCL